MAKRIRLDFQSFLKILSFYYLILVLFGIKKGPTFHVQFFYDVESTLIINDINDECKIYVHKAFYSSLKIITKELEQNQF